MHEFAELRHRDVVEIGRFARKIYRSFRGQRKVLPDLVLRPWSKARQRSHELAKVGRTLCECPGAPLPESPVYRGSSTRQRDLFQEISSVARHVASISAFAWNG